MHANSYTHTHTHIHALVGRDGIYTTVKTIYLFFLILKKALMF